MTGDKMKVEKNFKKLNKSDENFAEKIKIHTKSI